ncbi:MAG: hypothetical protein QM754_02790 [Tepidisphaeraceae bacterium]
MICADQEAEKFAQTHAATVLLDAEDELSGRGQDRNDRVLILIPEQTPPASSQPAASVR